MTKRSLRLAVCEVSEASVLEKVDSFCDLHVWPEHSSLNPRRWLENFTPSERPFAASLLNNFIYFNEHLVDGLLRSGVQALSVEAAASATTLPQAKSRWRHFLAQTLVTYVEGEKPSATDSGYVFARKARQVLLIDERQIVRPAEALRCAMAASPPRPVLFLDDFVGAGAQMSATWHRPYRLPGGRTGTFWDLADSGAFVVYTPLVATTRGLGRLKAECAGLRVQPAHVLDSRYSLTSADCILWPDRLRADAVQFLFDASKRAGIVGHSPHGWQGFHDLALALAFSHGVPDATMPLFYWDRDGWHPLIRRT
jgi:hypothetical protein